MAACVDLDDIVLLARHSSRLWEPSQAGLLHDCWIVLGVLWDPANLARVFALSALGQATNLSEKVLRQTLTHLQRAHMVRPGAKHLKASVTGTPGHFVNWLHFHLLACEARIGERRVATLNRKSALSDAELGCNGCSATYSLLDHPRLQTPQGTLECEGCSGSVSPLEHANVTLARSECNQFASATLEQLKAETRACVERRSSIADDIRSETPDELPAPAASALQASPKRISSHLQAVLDDMYQTLDAQG